MRNYQAQFCADVFWMSETFYNLDYFGLFPAAFSSNHDSSATCRSIGSLGASDVKVECLPAAQTFSIDGVDADVSK